MSHKKRFTKVDDTSPTRRVSSATPSPKKQKLLADDGGNDYSYSSTSPLSFQCSPSLALLLPSSPSFSFSLSPRSFSLRLLHPSVPTTLCSSMDAVFSAICAYLTPFFKLSTVGRLSHHYQHKLGSTCFRGDSLILLPDLLDRMTADTPYSARLTSLLSSTVEVHVQRDVYAELSESEDMEVKARCVSLLPHLFPQLALLHFPSEYRDECHYNLEGLMGSPWQHLHTFIKSYLSGADELFWLLSLPALRHLHFKTMYRYDENGEAVTEGSDVCDTIMKAKLGARLHSLSIPVGWDGGSASDVCDALVKSIEHDSPTLGYLALYPQMHGQTNIVSSLSAFTTLTSLTVRNLSLSPVHSTSQPSPLNTVLAIMDVFPRNLQRLCLTKLEDSSVSEKHDVAATVLAHMLSDPSVFNVTELTLHCEYALGVEVLLSITRMQQLQHLELREFKKEGTDNAMASDELVRALCSARFRQLTSLILRIRMTDELLFLILRTVPALKSGDIQLPSGHCWSALFTLAHYCVDLESLTVVTVTGYCCDPTEKLDRQSWLASQDKHSAFVATYDSEGTSSVIARNARPPFSRLVMLNMHSGPTVVDDSWLSHLIGFCQNAPLRYFRFVSNPGLTAAQLYQLRGFSQLQSVVWLDSDDFDGRQWTRQKQSVYDLHRKHTHRCGVFDMYAIRSHYQHRMEHNDSGNTHGGMMSALDYAVALVDKDDSFRENDLQWHFVFNSSKASTEEAGKTGLDLFFEELSRDHLFIY